MFDHLNLDLIFRRIAVERARNTPLPDLIGIVRKMIACQRLAATCSKTHQLC